MPGASAGVINQINTGTAVSGISSAIPTVNVAGVPTWNLAVVGDLVIMGATSEGTTTVHTNAQGMTKLISGTWAGAVGAWSVWYKIIDAADVARGSMAINGGTVGGANVYRGFIFRLFPLVAGNTLVLRTIFGQYNAASAAAQGPGAALSPNTGDIACTLTSFYGTGGSGLGGAAPVSPRWVRGNFGNQGNNPGGYGQASTTSTWQYSVSYLFKTGDTLPVFSEIPASSSDSAIVSFAVGVDGASPNVQTPVEAQSLKVVKGYTRSGSSLNVAESKLSRPLKGTPTDRDTTNGSQQYGGGVQII